MTTLTQFTDSQQDKMTALAAELNLPLEKVAEVVAFAQAHPLENVLPEEEAEGAPDLSHFTAPLANDPRWYQNQPNRHAQARRVAKQARLEATRNLVPLRRVDGGDIA